VLSRTRAGLSLRDQDLVDTPGVQVAMTVGASGADKLLAETGYTLPDLLRLDKENKDLPKFPLKGRLRVRSSFAVEDITTENVVALLPGADEKLRNEYIVLTAHLDHLGKGAPIGGDPIYNGAMDNASGIATLIEVARAMSGKKLRRSVMFAAVTSEEGGLLGSKYLAFRPPLPGKVVANLNSDMFLPIIPLKAITVLGLDESTLGRDFAEAAKAMGVPAEPDDQPQRNAFIRSDQYSFIRRGVPALAFKFHAYPGSPEAQAMVAWLKQRYHAPSDDLSQPVNLEGAAKFTAIMSSFLEQIANRNEAPSWYDNSFFRRYVLR
jgi:Zn-dependent M28 family amino/carboxypeptidase